MKGEVWGWGSNRYGQLGLQEDVAMLVALEQSKVKFDGNEASRFIHSRPVQLSAFEGVKVKQVAASGTHTLALSKWGQLFSFGWGMYGQVRRIANTSGSLSSLISDVLFVVGAWRTGERIFAEARVFRNGRTGRTGRGG
jgi:alpha-tubulin suppressor-like RCC1 family protein